MYLLDTHTFYWFITGDSKLPDSVKTAIEDSEEQFFISVACFWEMSIKSSLNKLKLPASIDTLMQDCSDYGISILQIKASHLARLEELPWIHRDPFDRLMICQAQEEDLIFITADGNITKYDVKTMWYVE
ncbi:MAG: type II toxin-antitoxin system VapC family toxin [Eubacterium sp.]|nr:type II toxin-antitoxin system VapC family toxin [Eubacterium sp.]